MHLSHQSQKDTKISTEERHPTFYHRAKEKRLLLGYNSFASMANKMEIDEVNIHFVKGYN